MRREHPRDGSSPVVADNVRATTGYRLDERRDVADEQVEAVVTAAGWWGAGRVAALIRGGRCEPRGVQVGRDRLPDALCNPCCSRGDRPRNLP